MSNYVTVASNAGDRFLERLAEYQEMWLKSFTAFNKYSFAAMPMAAPAYSTFVEVAKANFDFLQKLLAQQKKFAESVYSLGRPKPTSPAKKKTSTRPAAKSAATMSKASPKVSKATPKKAPPKN